MAMGCSNTHKDGVSLFKFPGNPQLRKKWVEQVKRLRDKWEPTEHSVLCSAHFDISCFEADSVISQTPGFEKRKVRLKAGAIPTLFRRPKKPGDKLQLPPPKRTAYEKRQRARVGCVNQLVAKLVYPLYIVGCI